MSDSYNLGRLGGISDGTKEGDRGASDYIIAKQRRDAEHQARLAASMQADTRNVGREVGDGLMAMIAAMFMNKYLSFVTFWLICFGLVAAAPIYLKVPVEAYGGIGQWWVWVAVSVPVVLTVLLRKIIPTLMRWTFIAAMAALMIALVVAVVQSR